MQTNMTVLCFPFAETRSGASIPWPLSWLTVDGGTNGKGSLDSFYLLPHMALRYWRRLGDLVCLPTCLPYKHA